MMFGIVAPTFTNASLFQMILRCVVLHFSEYEHDIISKYLRNDLRSPPDELYYNRNCLAAFFFLLRTAAQIVVNVTMQQRLIHIPNQNSNVEFYEICT